MLEDKVENLLLELAPVDAIVFQCQCNQALIINNTVEQRLESKIQVIKR